MKHKRFQVEFETSRGWRPVLETVGRSRDFCEGYLTAIEAMSPSLAHRLVYTLSGELTVLKSTKRREPVHVN